jgi:exodeoxyribonuclease-3
MRIATWNVNGLRARWPFLVHWLRARQPDLVALQELKLEDAQFPHAELQAEGYHAVTHGQKAWNGVAVLARVPLEVIQLGLPGQEEHGARLLSARLGELHFSSLYCPNGKSVAHPDFPRKLAWFETLEAHLRSSGAAERPAVLAGDFNLCPSALDSWNEAAFAGEIFHTAAERERFAALLGCGFRDLFREAQPELRAFSWWDYRGGAFHQNQGLRIDLLLGTPAVAARLKSVQVDREYRKKQEGQPPSDHAPVFADLAD